MFDAVIFDNDGVLVDTERLYFEATRHVLAELGVELTVESYRELFLVEGQGAWHLVTGLEGDALEAAKRRRGARYRAALESGDLFIPGCEAVINALARRYRLAIVTSSERGNFDAIHARGTLRKYFELILVREDYERSKPDPEPYRLATQRLGLRPERCLAIEDSQRGVRSAKAAGLACWAVPNDLTRGCDFSGADAVLGSLDDVVRRLMDAPAAAHERGLGD